MGGLLRLGGILLILGGVIYATGGYAGIRRAQIAEAGGSPQVSPGLGAYAQWIGIALMALGIVTAVAVLFMFIREMRAPKTYAAYTDEDAELMANHEPSQSGEQSEQGIDDMPAP